MYIVLQLSARSSGDGSSDVEVYEWNKITTCIHNLFGGSDRWVDLYGLCHIKSKGLSCKIDFVKASYWSNKKHEISGSITDKSGGWVGIRLIKVSPVADLFSPVYNIDI